MAKYVVAVQCNIVKERCSGYQCEREFTQRIGAFAPYADTPDVRFLSMTCGGCCGKATQRKLTNLVRQSNKREGFERNDIVVHLSSCVCKESYHGPVCPHLDYLRSIISDKLKLSLVEGTVTNELAEARRQSGEYTA
jgi:predicted metal-binding protein